MQQQPHQQSLGAGFTPAQSLALYGFGTVLIACLTAAVGWALSIYAAWLIAMYAGYVFAKEPAGSRTDDEHMLAYVGHAAAIAGIALGSYAVMRRFDQAAIPAACYLAGGAISEHRHIRLRRGF